MRRSVGWCSTDCTRGWCTQLLVSLSQYYQLVSGSLSFSLLHFSTSLPHTHTHTPNLCTIRETWFCPILYNTSVYIPFLLPLNKRHFRLLDSTSLSLSSLFSPSSSCHSRSPPVRWDLLDSSPSCPGAVAGGGTDAVGHYRTPPLPPPSLLCRLNHIRRGGRVSSVLCNFLQICIRDYWVHHMQPICETFQKEIVMLAQVYTHTLFSPEVIPI